MNFISLGIIALLNNAIQRMGYQKPTPIQQQAIPAILKGQDFIGCAQTGTGKTAAFSIPILQKLIENKGKHSFPRALILVPTRELATQIEQNIRQLNSLLDKIQKLIGFKVLIVKHTF